MKKYLSTLLAAMAAIALSANAQVTQTTEVTEVVPAQPTTTSTTTTDTMVTEVVPEQSTVTEIVPMAPATTVTEIVPAAPTSTVTEFAPPAPSTTFTEINSPAPPAPVVTDSTTVLTTNQSEVIGGQEYRLDPVVARRHLSVAPQTVTITPEQRVVLDREVVIESRPEPVRRLYNAERNVVIVEEQGQSRELPYLTVPVLFVKDTAELLNTESRMALEQTASVIKEIAQTEPNALFDVEGHTSMEGSAEHNMQLSTERSKRVYDALIQNFGVPATALTAHGYGQNFTMYPQGTELERQQDRRVLVVRTR